MGKSCSKLTGNSKSKGSKATSVFFQNQNWKNHQTQMSQVFAQNNNKDNNKDIK
jgi:hypothetical protein